MWRAILIATCVLLAVLDTEAASKRPKKRGVGSYSSSFSNSNGDNGGYVGNFDYDDFGYAPNFGFGFIDPYIFHQQLTSQILAQQAAQQNAIASTFSTGDATVTAGASNMPYDIPDYDYNDFFKHQQAALQNSIAHQTQFANKGNRYAPNYSAAAASIGPHGGYQTAHISPANPSSPNFSNRFGSVSPNGFKGVSVSSFSSSSDVNGKRTSHRGAQTTVNDNGKVTTYKVQS